MSVWEADAGAGVAGERGRTIPIAPPAEDTAWRGAGQRVADYRMALPEAVVEELDRLAARLEGYDGPIEDLGAERLRMPAVRTLMASVRARLDHGIGLVVLDRLSVERWSERTGKALVWLLTGQLGPLVSQKLNGTRLYEVRDSGRRLAHGVRRSITNLEQEFHTDGGWLGQTPETIALACIRQAEAGGTSCVASLAAAHDRLRREQPALLERLYRPFWWDRQGEHNPAEPKCSRRPVFAWDGARLQARYYDDYIRNGQRIMGEPLDLLGEAALDALRRAVAAPDNRLELRLEPGQIVLVDNRSLAHARTAFRDPDKRDAGRLLLRLWIRRTGGIALEAGTAAAS